MLRRSCQLAFLLLGLIWGGCLVVLGQATLDFTFDPTDPAVGEEICFTAVVVTGEAEWFVLYEWDYDQDGTYDATGPEVCRSFPTEGTRTVTLRGTDDRGGFIYVEHNVTVTNARPTARFTYLPVSPLPDVLVTFDGSTSTDPDGTIVEYEWNIDGVLRYGQIIRYAFDCAHVHQVTLTVTDNAGATDTSPPRAVDVRSISPVASFDWDPEFPSIHDPIQFWDDSFDPDCGDILFWHWTFGDGNESYDENPIYQYAGGGQYVVTLTVRDDENEVDTSSLVITVEGPTAAFMFSPFNPTTQDVVQFFDQSFDNSGDIVSWSWDFGDGSGTNERNPTHTFVEQRDYTVVLTITSDGAATSSTQRTITVGNAPPMASFSFSPASPNIGEMVTFSCTSTDADGAVTQCEWDFNEDGITDVTGGTITWTFSNAGAKLVSLTVTDDDGAQDVVLRVVPVQASPPTACFIFTPPDPTTGEAVAFAGNCSADADGTIILYEWDFDDDGVTDATGMAVTHSFPAAGVYPVTLMVTDNDGAVNADTQGVPVATGGTSGDNQPPDPDFSITFAEGDEANIGEVVTFLSDGSSDPDGTIVSYEWDFDNDGAYDATGTTASHVYHTGGAKIVTLRATDDDGAFGYKTRVVSVEFVRPTADFTFTPAQPRNGEVVQFDASTSTDRDGTVEFFEWDFDDDGETDATGMTVTHVFPIGGAMPVTLTVVDDDGVFDFTTRTVPVTQNNPPTADFDFDPRDPTTADSVLFESASSDVDGTIVAYLWDFDDGSPATSTQTPTHTFATPGTYDVLLTVTDDGGDTAEKTRAVVISEAPDDIVVDFTWDPQAPDPGGTVQFTDASTDPRGAVASWAWDFGDGATSTVQNPTHAYSAPGQYTVTLRVTTSDGSSYPVAGPKTHVISVGGEILYGYPNPARSGVLIVYSLPSGATDAVLRVYDFRGILVFEVALGSRESSYQWDLRGESGTVVGNGLYFVVVTATNASGGAFRSAVFRLLVAR